MRKNPARRARARILILGTSICLTLRGQAGAQASANTRADSATRAVQRFYDWYVPTTAKPKGRDAVMLAATRGPLKFDPELVRWLRSNSVARARNKDEVDGLDGDPYLNSQDPCERYVATAAKSEGASILVGGVGKGGCPTHTTSGITVKVGRSGTRWIVLEFLGPERNNEGLIPLLKQLHPNSKQLVIGL